MVDVSEWRQVAPDLWMEGLSEAGKLEKASGGDCERVAWVCEGKSWGQGSGLNSNEIRLRDLKSGAGMSTANLLPGRDGWVAE